MTALDSMPRKRKEIIQMLEQATAQRPPVLDLSHCNLGELLESVLRMTWLVELNLSHCHLSLLPETIGNLTSLTRLSLMENQLATLPDTITHLTALQHIDLTRAGYDLSVSETVMNWLKTVPEAIWTDGKPRGFAPPVPYFLPPDHPNTWLERIKFALGLYGDALNMEDRNFPGDGKRAEADARIAEIFSQVAELQAVLSEFYQDFLAHRFYFTSRDSENVVDQNPFHLPTKEDEEWLATLPQAPNTPPPLRLADAILGSRRRILIINAQTGQEAELVSCEHGSVTQMNTPYAADESYWADSAASLYQAGPQRFYTRVESHGYGTTSTIQWFSSGDSSHSWQPQAHLTHDWLNKTRSTWLELDHLAPLSSP